jgi:MFS superfamily sulfate permease-like transporter
VSQIININNAPRVISVAPKEIWEKAGSFSEFIDLFTFPDFSFLINPDVYTIAITLAVIGSLETLLSLEAVDRLDPLKRIAPTNRELKAQGLGNTLSGLIGGLPITAVIVRSSANINAGGRTKIASFVHGVFLLLSILFLTQILNLIPLACLAASNGYRIDIRIDQEAKVGEGK